MPGAIIEAVSLEELDGHDNLLQTGFWGRVKSRFGWTPAPFRFNGYPLLVLTRRLAMGMGIAYVPHGPMLEVEGPFFALFARHLARQLPSYITFIRFDLPWEIPSPASRAALLPPPFRKSAVDIQPPDTVIVSLKESEDEILARMKPKTRYNIRLAGKKGVTVREGGFQELEKWYAIYTETAERDGITIHSLDYYRAVLTEGLKHRNPSVRLLLAESEGEIVAGNIVVLHGKQATYLYGASRSVKRNYMPTYLLQWEAMRLAREHGCERYDLFGVPPEADEKHPMYGLYRFKTGFGGVIVSRGGCWDYPVRRGAHLAYRMAEGARNYYYKKVRR
jgi:lipid II:glycine glycyltransferase (peptidoglycan interpeptide bridge formation enzyme)